MEETREGVVVIDGSGGILCIGESKIYSLPLSEITLDNVFLFWSNSLEELKNFRDFSSLLFPEEIDLDSCSFLEIFIKDREKGLFSLG